MFCYFCKTQTNDLDILCSSCFSNAFRVAIKHYGTDDVATMIQSSLQRDEGDALTFRYASLEKARLKDMSGGQFIIDAYVQVTKLCNYDHHLWKDFFPGWLDLSTAECSDFWIQCFNRGG